MLLSGVQAAMGRMVRQGADNGANAAGKGGGRRRFGASFFMRLRVNWRLLGLCALCGFALLGYCLLGQAAAQTAAAGVLRLHVVANSDSDADQAVKLQVRDAVLEYIQNNAGQPRTEGEVRDFVARHAAQLTAAADAVLARQGCTYTSRVRLGVFDFPDKTYGDTLYPAGRYHALRVELGEAAGRNWWCVIFPPLCLTQPVAQPEGAGEPAQQGEGVRVTSFFAQLFGVR